MDGFWAGQYVIKPLITSRLDSLNTTVQAEKRLGFGAISRKQAIELESFRMPKKKIKSSCIVIGCF
jgi:hypothetical protein